MLSITLSDDVKQRLLALLDSEDDPDAHVRIREYKMGDG